MQITKVYSASSVNGEPNKLVISLDRNDLERLLSGDASSLLDLNIWWGEDANNEIPVAVEVIKTPGT